MILYKFGSGFIREWSGKQIKIKLQSLFYDPILHQMRGMQLSAIISI